MLSAVTLDDKYELDTGRIYVTGIQALVRLPLVQRRRDVAAGLNTGGFISGYRGSPLAAYDRELWRAKPRLEAHHIHFQPGVNEDLAATALWGSQQTTLDPEAKYDGASVFGMARAPGWIAQAMRSNRETMPVPTPTVASWCWPVTIMARARRRWRTKVITHSFTTGCRY